MAETNQTSTEKSSEAIYKFAEKDGVFRRPLSAFRSFVSSAPGAEFPPEKDRYVRHIQIYQTPEFYRQTTAVWFDF